MSNLQYSDLSLETIKKFHREHGGVSVELSANQGKLLRSMLDQRDCLGDVLLKRPKLQYLVWHSLVWTFYELVAHVFHKRLLILQDYVKAVDAAHGWETSANGKIAFLLLPLNSGKGPGLQRKEHTHETNEH
jgi:hypothetical protein